MKKWIGWMIGLFVILGLAVIIIIISYPQEIQKIGTSKYYVQVSDEGEENMDSSDWKYEYKLKGFDKDGKSKTLTFTATDRLKEDAYLRIYDKKGEVITYEEVKEDDMPKKPLQLLGG